jgi:hypothetical protein
VRLSSFKIILLLLAPWIFLSGLAHADYRELERTLPRIYRAFVETIGLEKTQALFAHFSKADSQFIGEKLSEFLIRLEQSEPNHEEKKRLIKGFGSRISGTLAEAIGLSRLREFHKDRPSIRIIDEVQFTIENGLYSDANGKYRPDGIAVESQKDFLIIHEVLESKMGGHFDLEQVQNWMQQWRRYGLTIDGVFYPPDKIAFQSGSKQIGLKGMKWNQVLPHIVYVTGSQTSPQTGRSDVLGLSKAERKTLLANLIAGGNEEDFTKLNKFQNRFRDAVMQAAVERIQAGQYPFPGSRSDGKDGKLGRAISGQWGNRRLLFEALPKYLRDKVLKMGFDPLSAAASSRRAFGNAVHSKESVRLAVIERIKAGEYPFPSQSDEGSDRLLAIGIVSHYGKAIHLFETLPKKYQEMSIASGFDPANPIRSRQQELGRVIWSKESVKQEIVDRIKLGVYPFPSRAMDGEQRSLAQAIERYWGSRRNLFEALPTRWKSQAVNLGFDPEQPGISAGRSKGHYKYSKESVREEAIARVKSNSNPFPSQHSEDDGVYGRAILNHWKSPAALLESLPLHIQKKASKLGFVPHRHTAESVREAVIERMAQGKYPFPSSKNGSEEERKLGEAIYSHWGKRRKLYEALPKRWQNKARLLGYNPDPKPRSERQIVSKENSNRVKDRKAWLKSFVEDRIREGKYPFPSGDRTNEDRNFRSMVSYHWGGVLPLFNALDPELAERAKELGFDPENVIGSGKKFLGSAHRSKESIKLAVIERIEAGLYPFPKRSAGSEESALSAAITNFWGNNISVYRDLSPQHQAKAVNQGFNPETGVRFHRSPCNGALGLLGKTRTSFVTSG